MAVSEATNNERVEAGHAYIAPGGYHLELVLADERARNIRSELLRDDGPFDASMQKIWNEHIRRH